MMGSKQDIFLSFITVKTKLGIFLRKLKEICNIFDANCSVPNCYVLHGKFTVQSKAEQYSSQSFHNISSISWTSRTYLTTFTQDFPYRKECQHHVGSHFCPTSISLSKLSWLGRIMSVICTFFQARIIHILSLVCESEIESNHNTVFVTFSIVFYPGTLYRITTFLEFWPDRCIFNMQRCSPSLTFGSAILKQVISFNGYVPIIESSH